jgi:hypothetical protein
VCLDIPLFLLSSHPPQTPTFPGVNSSEWESLYSNIAQSSSACKWCDRLLGCIAFFYSHSSSFVLEFAHHENWNICHALPSLEFRFNLLVPSPRKERIILERDELGRIKHSKVTPLKLKASAKATYQSTFD